ncbi:MAG: c(7)-type cytochrome triheme domain-containing protein [Hyphomicrobiaceae bacterium]
MPADSAAVPEMPVEAPKWPDLRDDGLHDPTNRGIGLLQQPREALSVLPPANEGNHVDWVAALRTGAINPRTNVFPETKIKVLDLDVLMEDTAAMPIVKFPHRPHTEWLDCENCHDKIFKAKRGTNAVNMLAILQGNFCGQCHGAVSFPLTQCARCHSVSRGQAIPQPAQGTQP